MTHFGHINIARMLAPLDSPVMAEFAAQLEAVNAIADATPGFVWRLQDDAGNATAIQPTADPLLLINLSVWDSLAALAAFTYRSGHAGVLSQKGRWFEPHKGAALAIWPIAEGHIPSIDEAFARLWHLDRYGPTARAFGLKDRAIIATLEGRDLAKPGPSV
jgi:heme-degrading monooxygenase HmoA